MAASFEQHLLVLGVNHRTAPVEVRERLAYQRQELPGALRRLLQREGIGEALLLSTCNRTEVYAVGPELPSLRSQTERFLVEDRHLSLLSLRPYLLSWEDMEGAAHLFRVACGVDSMVIGETQILGQVRDAYLEAHRIGATRTLLNELCQRALRLGKKVRVETEISRGAASIGSVAVELARNIFGSLEGHRVLLLGAGKMGEITAKVLMESGAQEILVANRTYARAVELAQRFGGRASPWEELPQRLTEVDILITSTAAPHFVVDLPLMQRVAQQRKGRPLFIIDIAVPRDVEPAVGRLEGIFLFDIDDLQQVVQQHRARREQEVRRVEAHILAEVEAFARWWESLRAKPVIVALRRKVEALRDQEMERWLRKMPHLSEKDRYFIGRMMEAFANKVLHDPLVYLRRTAHGPEALTTLETVRRLFNLDTQETLESEEPR